MAGALLPLAVSLVTIPLYLARIGEARYGVLAIAWLLLGYFGIFDLGLGRATAQRIAALRDASADERAETFWTALGLNAGLGIVGGFVIWPIAAYFFGHVFKIEDALRPEMIKAVPWLMVAVPMATLSGVLSGALEGRQRFLEINVISIVGTVFFQVFPLVAAIAWSPRLGVVLPVALLTRLLTLFALFFACRVHVTGESRPRFALMHVGTLLRFGGWVTVSSLVGPLMVIGDRFIIGAIANAKAVAYYTIPFQLGERSAVIPSSLASALFPRLTGSAPPEARRMALDSLDMLVTVMTPLIAGAILLIGPFLTWWIDPQFASHSTRVGQVILLGFWVNSFAKIPYAQLQARGRPDLVATCHLSELLPYFLLLYVGMHLFGLLGAAIAYSIRVLLDFLLLAGFAGVLGETLPRLAAPALLLTAAMAVAVWLPSGSPAWFAASFLGLLATTAWTWHWAPVRLRSRALALLGSKRVEAND